MVLGDDIVIYNKAVALEYSKIMSTLGVDISPTKSLTSKLGVFEFAKRLSSPEGPAQGLPLAEFAAARYNLNILFQSFRGRSLFPPLSLFMRFMGFGYKVLGSLGIPGNIGLTSKRRTLFETVAYAPGLTKSSLPSWGEFYKLSSREDLYVVLEGLVYKAYQALPSLPLDTRWNLVRTLLPDYSVLDLPKRTVQHLEMMFSNMVENEKSTFEDRYMSYVNLLESTDVCTTDWKSVDLILDLLGRAPSDIDFLHIMDEDILGNALSASQKEKEIVKATLSSPIDMCFNIGKFSTESVS